MDEGKDFGLVESFAIDEGQLDSLSKQDCFVLGYELATIATKAETDSGRFSSLIHASNLDRIKAALEKRGRKFRANWMAGDIGEEWVQLFVEAREDQKML